MYIKGQNTNLKLYKRGQKQQRWELTITPKVVDQPSNRQIKIVYLNLGYTCFLMLLKACLDL